MTQIDARAMSVGGPDVWNSLSSRYDTTYDTTYEMVYIYLRSKVDEEPA